MTLQEIAQYLRERSQVFAGLPDSNHRDYEQAANQAEKNEFVQGQPLLPAILLRNELIVAERNLVLVPVRKKNADELRQAQEKTQKSVSHARRVLLMLDHLCEACGERNVWPDGDGMRRRIDAALVRAAERIATM